jgi:hypothetical protein
MTIVPRTLAPDSPSRKRVGSGGLNKKCGALHACLRIRRRNHRPRAAGSSRAIFINHRITSRAIIIITSRTAGRIIARRIVRVRREAPIISGYSMPQSFARTDAVDSPFTRGFFGAHGGAGSVHRAAAHTRGACRRRTQHRA